MATLIPTIKFPELLFGFVAPIGVDTAPVVGSFRKYLEGEGYQVVDIKVTDSFEWLEKIVKPKIKLVQTPLTKRYKSHIAYGNQLRAHFKDDGVLASVAVLESAKKRPKKKSRPEVEPFSRTAYLLYQFKRKEEIDLLRSVYGRLFFQVSVYSRRGARVDYLSRKFAEGKGSTEINKFRTSAEHFVQQDVDEVAVVHGQRVGKVFHDADLIVNCDVNTPSIDDQVERFGELVFSSNSISPTKIEYGMFLAKAAALRTLDLSRQVGAAIFSPTGEIVSLGSNEVPKAGGGTYWADELYDDREYKRGSDSNDKRKREVLKGIFEAVAPGENHDGWLNSKAVKDSQFMDAMEYGRIVHTEMSAISDAARNGREIRDCILFSTTFPCHMCAKHIVAAGINKVVFLEPYPKSLASDLHSDSIEIEGSDRGQYSSFPAVRFEHFYGVTPRRYRDLFEGSRRKDSVGNFLQYRGGTKRPFIDIKSPFYFNLEKTVIESLNKNFFSQRKPVRRKRKATKKKR